MNQTFIAKNLGSSDMNRKVGGANTDVACTLLSRDYKGLGNYGSNIVIEITPICKEEFDKWKKLN